jgi:hypothetical protein
MPCPDMKSPMSCGGIAKESQEGDMKIVLHPFQCVLHLEQSDSNHTSESGNEADANATCAGRDLGHRRRGGGAALRS